MKMQVNPYLNFNGSCEEAMKFYAESLGAAAPSFHKYGGSPMANQVPPEWQDKVMHATLIIGNTAIMGADAPPPNRADPQGFCISLTIDTPEAAERAFSAMSKGGKVQMPIQKTFWSARFGMFIDQFGIPWMINCEQQP